MAKLVSLYTNGGNLVGDFDVTDDDDDTAIIYEHGGKHYYPSADGTWIEAKVVGIAGKPR